MANVAEGRSQRLTVAAFRTFVKGRPDEERWELIDGVAMMMTPPKLAHQRIGSNLEHLLNSAFREKQLPLLAYQRAGVNIGPTVDYYDPEPDVVVVDVAASREMDLRYVDRFYLAAEVVSSSDRDIIEAKRGVYKLHDTCSCILTIQQERIKVRVDLRTDRGWKETTVKSPEDDLLLPDFGLSCKVVELYRLTPLEPLP